MISIDWGTKVIFIPKEYTQFVSASPFEIRQLNIDQFRLDLRALEASVEGIPHERTHIHNTAVTVGGVTLARVVIIVNGYTITFEDGAYGVNLIGANSNLADVANLNQVQIRSSNSAGLTFSEEINNQSYIGAKVFINTEGLGLPGTQFPRGTPTNPVDNWDDAFVIATNRKFVSYDLNGVLTLYDDDEIFNKHWFSSSPITGFMYFNDTDLHNSTFNRLTIFGSISGRATYSHCALGGNVGLDGFDGAAEQCSLNGNIIINSGATELQTFSFCISATPGTLTPILDCNNAVCDFSIRSYTGGLKISNFTAGRNMSIDLNSGNVIIDETCTSGTIVVRGVGTLTNKSGPNCTVIHSGLADIRYFTKSIYIDPSLTDPGYIGDGSSGRPFRYLSDAMRVSENYGINEFYILSDIVLSQDLEKCNVYLLYNSKLDANGFSLNGSKFYDGLLSGEYTGRINAYSCAFLSPFKLDGYFRECSFLNEVFIRDNAIANFYDCNSIGTIDTAIINYSGVTNSLVTFNDYSGDITFKNYTDTNILRFTISQGTITLDPSCTSGYMELRGLAKLTDNSSPGCTVDSTALLDPNNINFSGGTFTGDTAEIASAVWNKLVEDHDNDGSFGELLTKLIEESYRQGHIANVHTEILKNQPTKSDDT